MFAPVFSLSAARCECAQELRSVANAVWTARLAVPVSLAARAVQVGTELSSAIGRVISGGRFKSDAAHATLAAALPEALRPALRDEFEWYGCRGAYFHNDAHYGEVLFGAWCVHGPARQVVFARAQQGVPAQPGDCVLFDPFEPHAVLDAGQFRYQRAQYEHSAPSVFLGFELTLTPAVRRAFAIAAAPADTPLLASRIAVNAETGALA